MKRRGGNRVPPSGEKAIDHVVLINKSRNEMKITALQTNPVFGDREGNLARALDSMNSAEADLFMLPELFATGYLFTSREELASLAESVDGPTSAALKRFTRDRGCTLYAGIPLKQGEKIYNAGVLFNNGRIEAVYYKLHLFNNEKMIFDRSPGPMVVSDSPMASLGLMICFDWVFPEMARSLALEGAQVLCLCANLLLPFCQDAMITRSIENRVFTVLANRVGTEERGGDRLTFSGRSEIIDPYGKVLVRASADKEEVIHAEIDPKQADDKMLTPENHIFSDRRTENYLLGDWQDT